MSISPSSSVQRARRDLADRLRDLRQDARLTARALSAAAGWHESKTSRIESAKQVPTEDDLRTWCTVCGNPDRAIDLIAASRAADSMYLEWRRVHRTGLRQNQVSWLSQFERTAHYKSYVSNVIPGIVQTPAYARHLMEAITRFQGTPDDVDEAVRARMERQRLLRSGNHQFDMVLEESVLHQRLGGAEVMGAQLDHLLRVMSMPSVRLGVIPFVADRHDMWTLEAFTIFDDAKAEVELLAAQVNVTAPSEVVAYVKAFDRLADEAVFGHAVRRLIGGALAALA